jgi:predicted nucleic acid-binding protein
VILIDTDVLIAHLRGVPQAHSWLREAAIEEPTLAMSVVTVAEILGGMRSVERQSVRALLAAIPAVPVSEIIARRAGELRREFHRSHSGIATTDYLIAATAETVGAELATLNVRRFPMFAGLTAPFRLEL